MLDEYYGGYAGIWDGSTVAVCMNYGGGINQTKALIEEFCCRLAKSIELYLNTSVTISIHDGGSTAETYSIFEKLERVSELGWYEEGSSWIHASSASSTVMLPQGATSDYIASVESSLRSFDYGGLKKATVAFRDATLSAKSANIVDVASALNQAYFMVGHHAAGQYEGFEQPDLSAFVQKESAIDAFHALEGLIDSADEAFRLSNTNYSKKIVAQAQAFMEQHISEKLSLKAVSDHVGLSPNYFSTLFKKTTGEKYVAWLMRLRVEKAVRMLETGESVDEVMISLGFENYTYFLRLLKSMTGKGLKDFS
jgi:YesN/AraC family two-component response regulator